MSARVPPGQSGYVRIENVYARKATRNALLCDVDGEEVWIPKSQVSEESQVREEEDEGILVIPEWLAKAKKLV